MRGKPRFVAQRAGAPNSSPCCSPNAPSLSELRLTPLDGRTLYPIGSAVRLSTCNLFNRSTSLRGSQVIL